MISHATVMEFTCTCGAGSSNPECHDDGCRWAIQSRETPNMISQSEIRLERMRDRADGVVMERELAELKTWVWHHAGLLQTEEGRHKFCEFLNRRIKSSFRPRDPNDLG